MPANSRWLTETTENPVLRSQPAPPRIAEPARSGGYRTSSATQCKLRRVTGQWWLIAAEYLRPVFDWTRRYTGAQIVRFVERDLRADALATARQAGSAFASWPIATYSRTGCPRPARHFREAIELCTRTGYDVVLLDCLHSYA